MRKLIIITTVCHGGKTQTILSLAKANVASHQFKHSVVVNDEENLELLHKHHGMIFLGPYPAKQESKRIVAETSEYGFDLFIDCSHRSGLVKWDDETPMFAPELDPLVDAAGYVYVTRTMIRRSARSTWERL